MNLSATTRECLEAIDVDRLRKVWDVVFPHIPQPVKDADMVVQIHLIRTQASSIAFKLRAYSHRWLTDNGYPSLMPDELRPRAERLYPRIVEGVMIAVKASDPLLKPVAKRIERAMSDAVEDAYAEGRREPEFVRARMEEARVREKRFFAQLLEEAEQRRR